MTSNPETPDEDVWRDRIHPVEEDMAFQRSAWRFERVGWSALLLILFLALLGLFGGGPLSHARLGDTTGQLQIDYERFTRKGSATELRLGITPVAGQSETRIRLSTDFLNAYQIEATAPEPVEMRTHPEGAELVFRAGQSGPFVVSLSLRPQSLGPASSSIALDNNAPVAFWSFAYP